MTQVAAVPLVIKRQYTVRADLMKYGSIASCGRVKESKATTCRSMPMDRNGSQEDQERKARIEATEHRFDKITATKLERTHHEKFVKRRREGDEKAADEDNPMDAGADTSRVELVDEEAVPFEASLVEGMLERDAKENEEEVERVVLAIIEKRCGKRCGH